MTTEKTYTLPFLKEPAHFYTLDNGHTIIAIKKPGEITNICTWVKTGSINENDINSGVSHFLEHLMFKGTERLKPGEFDKMLESRGGIINAATWKDYTYYYVTIPNGENDENYKLAIDLHADMMVNSILPDEEIGPVYDINDPEVKTKRERSVVIEEISMREDMPWTKVYNSVNSLMYSKHPYKRDTIGKREIIASIPREDILNYYHDWYVPENVVTVIVSDHEPEEMLEIVKKHFVFKEVIPSPESIYESEVPAQETKQTDIKGDIETGFGIIGFLGPKPVQQKESIAIEVISIIFGEGRSSRLYQNLVEKPANPIFNTVGCYQYMFRDGNNILIQFNFKPERKEEAIEALKEQLSNIQKQPITDEELYKAKKKLESRFAEAAETASGIAESIGYQMILTNDITNYTNYLSDLETVTIDDVQKAAKKYLAIIHACITTLTPGK